MSEIRPLKILKILKYPDPFLGKPTLYVNDFDEELAADIRDMFVTMYSENGIGLAANQVGLDKRMFVMDTSTSGNKRQVFINPTIDDRSLEQDYTEGCLSFPGASVIMQRATKITIRAQNEKGEAFGQELQGLDAICFLHEFDHLHGITFVDHLSQLKKHMILKKIRKYRG
jgi:peptide deformylase